MSLHNCQFEVGEQYRVKRDFAYLNHVFHQNEIVIFSTHAYDPHLGVTRYWFQKPNSDEQNAWHVWDNEPANNKIWNDWFDKISDGKKADLKNANS